MRGAFVELSEKNIQSELPLEAPQFSTSLLSFLQKRTESIMSWGYIDTPIFIVFLFFLATSSFIPGNGMKSKFDVRSSKEGSVLRSTDGYALHAMAIISPLDAFLVFYPHAFFIPLLLLIGSRLSPASCNPLNICYTALTFKPVLDDKTLCIRYDNIFATWVSSYTETRKM
jgi:hypothetical protein